MSRGIESRIAVISDDEVLFSRMHLYVARNDLAGTLRHYPSIETFSAEMRSDRRGGRRRSGSNELPDLLVVPATSIASFTMTGVFRIIPILMYGSRALLAPAFLFGCADFLRDPWSPEEFWIRAERWTTRVRVRYPWGDLALQAGSLTGPQGAVHLERTERIIFRMLAQFRDEPVYRSDLRLAVCGDDRRDSRVVDVYISRLRTKVRRVIPPGVPDPILTVHRQGYSLVA